MENGQEWKGEGGGEVRHIIRFKMKEHIKAHLYISIVVKERLDMINGRVLAAAATWM